MRELCYQKELVQRYNLGESLTSLAKSEKMRKEKIKQILLNENVELRLNRGGSRQKLDWKIEKGIVNLCLNYNRSFQEIANEFNISSKVVRKYCRKNGLYETRFLNRVKTE